MLPEGGMKMDIKPWIIEVVAETKQRPQTQEPLNDQLYKLCFLANRFGLYDAADFVRNVLEK
jgi:hypothetical protein